MKSTNTRERRDRRSAAEWHAIVDEQAASGQTIQEFAQERGLNPRTLAWWRTRLHRDLDRQPSPPPAFVEITADRTEGRWGAAIEVMLPNGIVIAVADHVDPARLAGLVAALGPSC